MVMRASTEQLFTVETGMTHDLMLIGIDPAPTKPAAVVYGTAGSTPATAEVAPRLLATWLRDIMANHPGVLVAWDAPLSFSPTFGFSDRPIDKTVRAFVAEQVKAKNGGFENGAISALPFSGCPHWAITCEAVGTPFGDRQRFLMPTSRDELKERGSYLIEVHPAVTIGMWWLEQGLPPALRRYKPGGGVGRVAAGENRKALVSFLQARTGLAECFFQTDDRVDATVAWTMARDFAAGKACWVGDPECGGYVLPSKFAQGLNARVEETKLAWKVRSDEADASQP